MKTPQTTIHTTPLGETVSYQIRNILGIKFLDVRVNFHPIKHIKFASDYIGCIPGIIRITSVSINKDDTGTFYFSLATGYNSETIMNGIAHEFEAYFSDLNMHSL